MLNGFAFGFQKYDFDGSCKNFTKKFNSKFYFIDVSCCKYSQIYVSYATSALSILNYGFVFEPVG